MSSPTKSKSNGWPVFIPASSHLSPNQICWISNAKDERKAHSHLATGVWHLQNLWPCKTQSIPVCLLLSLLGFEICCQDFYFLIPGCFLKSTFPLISCPYFHYWDSVYLWNHRNHPRESVTAIIWPRHLSFRDSAVIYSLGHQNPQDRE